MGSSACPAVPRRHGVTEFAVSVCVRVRIYICAICSGQIGRIRIRVCLYHCRYLRNSKKISDVRLCVSLCVWFRRIQNPETSVVLLVINSGIVIFCTIPAILKYSILVEFYQYYVMGSSACPAVPRRHVVTEFAVSGTKTRKAA